MKKRRTYEDEELGWWSRHLECEGSKISEQLPPLERTKAPKIRQGIGEDKVLTQFSLNLSRVSLIPISNMNYEGPKPSLYRGKGWS